MSSAVFREACACRGSELDREYNFQYFLLGTTYTPDVECIYRLADPRMLLIAYVGC